MNVDAVDSIIHLLKSISIWGVLFILLFILPIYIAAWMGIVKLLSLKAWSKNKILLTIFISFTIAFILLKIGVDKDQEKGKLAARVKQYMISYGFRGYRFDDLVRNAVPDSKESDLQQIVDRFSDEFTITYFMYGDSVKKGCY